MWSTGTYLLQRKPSNSIICNFHLAFDLLNKLKWPGHRVTTVKAMYSPEYWGYHMNLYVIMNILDQFWLRVDYKINGIPVFFGRTGKVAKRVWELVLLVRISHLAGYISKPQENMQRNQNWCRDLFLNSFTYLPGALLWATNLR